MHQLHPRLSVVLPCHNEEHNVAPMAEQLAETSTPRGEWELVFVCRPISGAVSGRANNMAASNTTNIIRFGSFGRNAWTVRAHGQHVDDDWQHNVTDRADKISAHLADQDCHRRMAREGYAVICPIDGAVCITNLDEHQ
jgi:hypothetical protein